MVAAEFLRRASDGDGALAAYGRAIAHYERAIESDPSSREACDHYVALALAGRSRIALERGELERALDEILASFQRRPEAAANLDGLNLTPVDTANMLRTRLAAAEQGELTAKLQSALDALDPELLQLPEYERATPGGPSADAQRFGRRREAR
jgi:tetratricopeptide (TPR) repeat protein